MEEKTIGKSGEDYLKAILKLKKRYGACRSVDISNEVGVSKASTSIAIKKLEQDGLIVKDDWRINLTEAGMLVAERMYEKNLFLTKWFKEIGVSEVTAEADACMVEHAISEETYVKIRNYINRCRGLRN